MDKERRVFARLDELSGSPFHCELYHLLLLTQTLPSVLRGAGSFQCHLDGSLGCRRCLIATLIGIPGDQFPLLQPHPEPCVRP